jgi:hypothetical protein
MHQVHGLHGGAAPPPYFQTGLKMLIRCHCSTQNAQPCALPRRCRARTVVVVAALPTLRLGAALKCATRHSRQGASVSSLDFFGICAVPGSRRLVDAPCGLSDRMHLLRADYDPFGSHRLTRMGSSGAMQAISAFRPLSGRVLG